MMMASEMESDLAQENGGSEMVVVSEHTTVVESEDEEAMEVVLKTVIETESVTKVTEGLSGVRIWEVVKVLEREDATFEQVTLQGWWLEKTRQLRPVRLAGCAAEARQLALRSLEVLMECWPAQQQRQ